MAVCKDHVWSQVCLTLAAPATRSSQHPMAWLVCTPEIDPQSCAHTRSPSILPPSGHYCCIPHVVLSSVLSRDGLLLDHSCILIPWMPLILQATLAGILLPVRVEGCSVLSSSLRGPL